MGASKQDAAIGMDIEAADIKCSPHSGRAGAKCTARDNKACFGFQGPEADPSSTRHQQKKAAQGMT